MTEQETQKKYVQRRIPGKRGMSSFLSEPLDKIYEAARAGDESASKEFWEYIAHVYPPEHLSEIFFAFKKETYFSHFSRAVKMILTKTKGTESDEHEVLFGNGDTNNAETVQKKLGISLIDRTFEKETDSNRDKEMVEEFLGVLSPMERNVIELQFGIAGTQTGDVDSGPFGYKSLRQVGEIEGLSHTRVAQITAKGFHKMRRSPTFGKLSREMDGQVV